MAPLLDAVDGGLVATGGADVMILSCPVPLAVDGSVRLGPVRPPSGRAGRLRAAPHEAGRRRGGQGVERGRDRRTAGRHRRGVAVVVAAAPGLRRSVARPRPPQRTGAPGAVVPTHRRDLRRGHHLAARGRRRRPQLGLPLRLGPGRLVHHRGAVGGGLPRRGQPVLRLRDRPPRPAPSSRPATCRSCSASAASGT